MSHLGKSFYSFTSSYPNVLILVVMDVALGPRRARRYKEDEKMVLILVVMDVALGQVFSQTLRNQ